MNKNLITVTPEIVMEGDTIQRININLPGTWSELNDEQLLYILQLQASSTMSAIEVRTCALMRFCGMIERAPRNEAERELNHQGQHIFRTPYGSNKTEMILPEWFLQQAVSKLSWLDRPTEDVTRAQNIAKGFDPYDATFADMPFGVYLQIESLWQQAMAWAEAISPKSNPDKETIKMGAVESEQLFESIARLLYRPHYTINAGPIKLPRRKPFAFGIVMQQNVVHWLTGWRMYAQNEWPHLFRGGSGGGSITQQSIRENIDVQLQALTGGDVTKMQQVLDTDTHSALRMLDIKQHDAELAKMQQEKNH